MTIHQKINSKANQSKMYPHFIDTPEHRERHAESIAMIRKKPMRIMKRNYTGTLDLLDSHRIYYRQDRKTNFQEPKY